MSLRLVRVHLGLVLLFRVWLALVSSVRGGVKRGEKGQKKTREVGFESAIPVCSLFIYFFELVKIKKKKEGDVGSVRVRYKLVNNCAQFRSLVDYTEKEGRLKGINKHSTMAKRVAEEQLTREGLLREGRQVKK